MAHAALEGELWEVSTQMNIPGMPAGMGGQKSRVCTEKGDRKKAMQSKGSEKCKVTDFKESGNKITMTMQCPDGTAVMETTYNAAHTEYNGTMKMTSKRGDMTMTMAGKKLGACDLQVAQQDRADTQAKAKAMQADIAAMTAQMNRDMEMNKQQAFAKLKAECDEGAAKMDAKKFAIPLCQGKEAAYAQHCIAENSKDPKQREGFKQYAMPAQDKAFCQAKKAEFCKNLQTPDGFALAAKTENVGSVPLGQRVPQSSAFCGVKNETLAKDMCTRALDGPSWKFLPNCPAEAKSAAPKLCPQAAEKEAYAYLGEYCPAEAKPLYTKYCAGRDFTSMYEKKDKKKFQMCTDLGIAMAEKEPGASHVPTSTQEAVDAAKQGVSQGINKLKGLFGR